MPGVTGRRAPRWLARRALVVVTTLGVLGLTAAVLVNLSLTSRLGRIDGAFHGLGARPPSAPGDTILMVGTRPGGGNDVAWLARTQSVEAVMLVEVHADGRRVLVESLPELAASRTALRSGPASNAVSMVESWSGRRVDHMIAVDWHTFAELAADNDVDATYRYGSAPALQHDYLREVLTGTLHTRLRKQPLNLYHTLRKTADGSAVDDEWSVPELDWLAVRLRNLRSHDIVFTTAQPS